MEKIVLYQISFLLSQSSLNIARMQYSYFTEASFSSLTSSIAMSFSCWQQTYSHKLEWEWDPKIRILLANYKHIVYWQELSKKKKSNILLPVAYKS